jgi:site-specific DNA-methyltransferase (adenine-specific)
MTELKIETVAINSLTPDPANARKHDGKNLQAIENSLLKFGQRKPICVTPDSIVVAGNGTLEAAKSLGWTEIVIARTPVGWSWEQIRAFALADNRTAELAEWDDKVLADQLLELDANGWELEELGFESLQPPIDQDDDEPLSFDDAPTRAKLGDVWKLGNHKVLCGDSNDQTQLDKLLNGLKLDAIIQDPPYGVLEVEWDRPLSQKDLDIALANSSGPILMFNATKPKLVKGILELEPQADRILVWRMTAGITGKGGMFWTWQPVFVWNANKKMIGWDSIDFESDAPTRTGEHLTQKPIGLLIKYIKNIPEAKNIGDFFLGSGTTLLACEQLNKVCYGAEIDPRYVDVILKRWENLTGKTAELVEE